MASSEAGFNELMRVLLDSFSKQERALFREEHKGEQGNGFRPRRWRGHGCSFQLRIPGTRSGAFQPIILGILAAQESERALLFMSCRLVDFPVKTSGGAFPLTILKCFCGSSAISSRRSLERYYSRWQMLHKKKTSRRRSVEMSGMQLLDEAVRD